MAFAGWVPEKDWEAETTTPEQLLAEYTDIIQNNGEYSRPENEVNFLKSLFNATLTLKGSEFDLLNSYLQIDQSGTMPLRAVFRALP